MRGFVACIIAAAVFEFSVPSIAQVSTELAATAVGEEAQLELTDGSSLRGLVIRVSGDAIVIRGADGRLSEVDRNVVRAIFLDEFEPPEQPQRDATEARASPLQIVAPRPPPVTEEEYLFAQRRFDSGTTLRAVGIGAIIVAAAAVTASYAFSADSGFADCDYVNGGCQRTSSAFAGVAMVALFAGVPTFIVGKRRRAQHTILLQNYYLQNPDAVRGRSADSDESEPSAGLAFSPLIARGGGGLSMNGSF